MLKSHPFLSLFLLSGIVSAGWACSSGDGDTTVKVNPPVAGAGTSAAGSSSGGSGVVSTAGSPAMGGSDSGQAGSQPVAGSVSIGGGTGGSGTGGSGTGGSGTGGSGTGGTGTGGTGGGTTGGSGGAGEDPNKIVLYDGSDASFKSWKSVRNGGTNPWKNNADKSMTVQTNTGDIQSSETFQDAFFHVEYMTPKITDAGGGQERGNSGIYLKGSWELQVLDTFGLTAAIDGCGAIYEVSKPLAVACYKGEEWNTYEIEFKAQVCANGQATAPAKFVEVKLNGVLVQQNVSCPTNETRAGQKPSCDPKGLLLQDHSSILPVSFRNIWAIRRTP